ncbi:MAG: cation diffusion facilitator family transporter [Candidatus Nanoarchaeia archaeon]|jgi:cation diffusion facilitator family transporter
MIKLKKSEHSIIISAIISFFLLILKLVAGLLTNSIVLISEALDSFTDLLSMVGSYIGIKISAKKPNNDFNYGFGKAENVTSFFISLLILFAAYSIGKMAYDSFFSDIAIQNSVLAYGAGIVSMITSAFLSFYLLKKSKELNSELLFINSRERLADILRGFVVISSIYLHESGILYIQGIVTLIICFAVFFIGIKSLAFSIKGLMDNSPGKKIIQEIQMIISKNKDVSSFKNLRLKKSGSYILGDVEIKVNKKYSIKKAHDVADALEKSIKEKFNDVASFIIHVEPNE